MNTVTTIKNWEIGTTPSILENIHQKDVNIAIYKRDISTLASEISRLLQQNIELRTSGDIITILNEVTQVLNPEIYCLMMQDIKDLLQLFKEITNADSFRLLLGTISTNMCRKFHTDMNNLRLLCTYSGPGTLWLPEDNINRKVLNSHGNNEAIVIDESKVQQAKTGAVVILKGAIYPLEGTKAVVHRSPTIEESGEKRLLLRLDTNKFLNF